MSRIRRLEGRVEEIELAMKRSKDVGLYRRLQCIQLGMKQPAMTTQEIAKFTLYSESNVSLIFKRYKQKGIDGLIDMRGGRYRENMSMEEEQELLRQFIEESKTGKLVVANKIKKAYESKLGTEVPKSTIYRLLDRHNFRKIAPYKRHTKADAEVQEAFKKTISP